MRSHSGEPARGADRAGPAGAPSGLRARLAYGLGSAAVAWCAAAMVVAAGPASATMGKVYPIFRPFLRAVELDHEWGFFAPDPGTGHVVRYELRDADGRRHTFSLTEELQRWDPAYFRFTTFYTKVSKRKSEYAATAARVLCRRHEDLSPARLRFVVAHQVLVSPEEFRDGVGTMDELTLSRRAWHDCPQGGRR